MHARDADLDEAVAVRRRSKARVFWDGVSELQWSIEAP
jgi:hypothetical protein